MPERNVNTVNIKHYFSYFVIKFFMILIIENFFSKQIIKTDAFSVMKNTGVYRNIWINTFNIPHTVYDHKCLFISLSKM